MMRRLLPLAAISLTSCIGHERIATASDAELNAWHYPLRIPDAIAHEVPGFGGFWFDRNETRLNVHLVDLKDSTKARSAIERILASHRQRLDPNRSFAFHKADYNFLQLDIWRCAIPKGLDENFDGYIGSSVRSNVNRIRLTVVDAAAERRVRKAMKKLRIPEKAVEFERGSPISLL
jgi:hypothetical protein